MNNYYVYIYYRLDTNEPFYVGMGHNNRWKELYENKRNEHFIRIINKYPIAVEIIKDNLTEEQAHGIEIWLINELVFEYGYSIDIPNNRSNEKGCHLVNCTWGGEGVSGLNVFENKTEEEMKEIKKKMSNAKKGVPLSKEHKKHLSENHYDCKGENHYNYGRHHSEEAKKKISEANKGRKPWINKSETEKEEWKKKISESRKGKYIGKNSGAAKSIICITTMRIFESIVDAGRYYNCDNSRITKCCKGKAKSAGKLPDGTKLVWRYIIIIEL